MLLKNILVLFISTILFYTCHSNNNESKENKIKSALIISQNDPKLIQNNTYNLESVNLKYSANLIKANDCKEVETNIKEELIKKYKRNHKGYEINDNTIFFNGTAETAATAATSTDSSASTVQSYSTTNVQELGVDEGDIVKTDGTYLYYVSGYTIYILNVESIQNPYIIKKITLNDSIQEIYYDSANTNYRKLIVITNEYNSGYYSSTYSRYTPNIKTYFYNVTNPVLPILERTFKAKGYYKNSRYIHSKLYLVHQHSVDIANPSYPWNYYNSYNISSDKYKEYNLKAFSENINKIQQLKSEEILPYYTTNTPKEGDKNIFINCDKIHFPEFGNGNEYTVVSEIDTSSSEVNSTVVFTYSSEIYMSQESLYLSSDNSWLWIEPSSSSSTTIENPEQLTGLHKFSISSSLQYKASGLVPGWVNNRFSMSEYNGFIRIGTTKGGRNSIGTFVNQLSIYKENESKLSKVSSIENLAKGERIYSMRFDKTKGYMVTFRQTDPLFTFDLSNPENPILAGELKVSGFSMYIHIIGENNSQLLTIGRETDSNGRVIGNKLQLFDVSNLSSPALLNSYNLGSGWSEALYDPHAFLYYYPYKILAIPYYTYSSSYSSGLKVFGIISDSISFRGDISNQDTNSLNYQYTSSVRRALIIADKIVTFSDSNLKVSNINDLKEVKKLPLN